MNLQGTYTRKRDGLTCSYRAECTEWGTDVAWSADVYVGERLVSEASGKLVLVPVAAVELEHAVRHAVEQSIESSDSIQSEAR